MLVLFTCCFSQPLWWLQIDRSIACRSFTLCQGGQHGQHHHHCKFQCCLLALFAGLCLPTPWDNCNGWLGVKHQITYLLLPASVMTSDWLKHCLQKLQVFAKDGNVPSIITAVSSSVGFVCLVSPLPLWWLQSFRSIKASLTVTMTHRSSLQA